MLQYTVGTCCATWQANVVVWIHPYHCAETDHLPYACTLTTPPLCPCCCLPPQDPNFREHFAIPHPTDAYAATLTLLPDEFIGSSSRLVPLVQIMCAEMAASFEAKGLTLPPWRRAQAMLSKWLPQRMSDQPLSSAQRCSSSGASVEGTSPGSEGSGPGGDSDDDCGGASSPFCRISAVEVQRASKRAGRTGSSLLSGKLCSSSSSSAGSNGGKAVASAGDGKNGSNACAGALTRRTSSGGGAGVGAAAASAGSVNRCPPMYRGEPATYSVKLPQAPAQ